MDQELAKCNKVHDLAIYNRRKVFVTIKKHNVNKRSQILIRHFTGLKRTKMHVCCLPHHLQVKVTHLSEHKISQIYHCTLNSFKV